MSLRRATVLLTATVVLLLGGGAVVAEEPGYGPLDTQCRVFGKWFAVSSNVEDHDLMVTPEKLHRVGSDRIFERAHGVTVGGFEDWPADRLAVYRPSENCNDCGGFVVAHVMLAGKYSYHPCKLDLSSFYTEEDLKTHSSHGGGATYAPDTLN